MNQITTEQEPTPQAEAPDAFESAFLEAASSDAEPPAAAGDPVDTDPAPDAEPEAQPALPAGEEAGTEIAADDAQPAPSSEQAPTDLWANAPPELKAAYEAADTARRAAEHRLASDNGRVAALNRQLDELRRQSAAGITQDAAPTGAKALLETDKIKALRAEYGEVAEPFLEILTAQQAELDRLKGTAQVVERGQHEAFIDSQVAVYERDHPDWRDYATHEKFGPWLQTQPRHIQEAATRNSQEIVDAAEASDVLSRFKLSIGATQAPQPAPTPTPVADPTPSATDAKRQKQLEASADVRTKGLPVTTGIPDDFDAAFNIAAAQADKRR